MLKKELAFVFLILGLIVVQCNEADAQDKAGNTYRIVFYNSENFFDISTDSTIDYNEFTPDGERHWNMTRYKAKRNQLYKVITAIGGWKPPAVVAFAELENRFVLEDLIAQTPLRAEDFEVVHFESNDHRGIDVGLIYDNQQVDLLFAKPVRYNNPNDTPLATRDILYAKFLLNTDTLHLLVNHWPSRYGGTLLSAPLRQIAASTLKALCDSICMADGKPNLLIMGDFNDDPEDESISLLTDESGICKLINLELVPTAHPVKGTLKYRAEWNIFDQIIVSPFLLSNGQGLIIPNGKASVYSESYLLEEDEKYLGMKPKRTYNGFKYHGGYSDHLPVYVDISMNENR